jgi:hypothetical protein
MILFLFDRGPPGEFILPMLLPAIPVPDLFFGDTLQPLLLKGELSRKSNPPDAGTLWSMTTLASRAEGFRPSHLGHELHVHLDT